MTPEERLDQEHYWSVLAEILPLVTRILRPDERRVIRHRIKRQLADIVERFNASRRNR